MFTFILPFYFVILFFTTTAQPYKPTDIFFLNCGSSTSNSILDQTWNGDEHSKSVPSNINTNSFSSTPDRLDPSLPQTPYSTARIFNTSSFTYTFPVSQGPKFLRLHFYPATYSNLKREQSFFSVSSNGYSLLTNFSAFLTLSFLQNTRDDAQVVKEFLIYVKDAQILNVTFKPSQNSYAFINGIEIISMPQNLYFNAKTPKYVGPPTGPHADNNTALENMYRLNMGGAYIVAKDDTGMYRSWEQDDYYIYGASVGVTPNYPNPIMYTIETPNYTAPELVYKTQRSMGEQADKFNLTWILPVDSGFYYMLRLHFCSIIRQYTKSSKVIFMILINNQTAEKEADPLVWIQGSGYPIFKDYIVFVNDPDRSKSKHDLWLELYPSRDSEYLGAYLNGLEVFKLSMDKSLASANPELGFTTTPTGWKPTVKGYKKKTPYGMIIGGIGGALIVLSIVVLIVFRQRRSAKHDEPTHSLVPSQKDGSTNSLLPSQRCRRFSLKEMKESTHEFDENLVIGVGGFGKVYKGFMDNATTFLAIKRLDATSKQGFQEFRTEIRLLSELRHVQLVSLIGYCDEEGEMILVYEYMAHGTLREHLYNTNKPPLPWKKRLDICIGAAKGLQYLHTGGDRSIIHRDVKSTNILLSENWVAKVSDFGLSKLGPRDQSQIHVSTMVKGSIGYLDPQYFKSGKLTDKSDVYSFGVVLLEVLCARPAVVTGQTTKLEVKLAEWGKHCLQNGTLHNIIDPKLKGVIAPDCLKRFGLVAVSCVNDQGNDRPTMDEVVFGLEMALKSQEDAEKTVGGDVSENQEPLFPMQEEATNITDDDDDDLFTRSTLTRNGTSSISSSYTGCK